MNSLNVYEARPFQVVAVVVRATIEAQRVIAHTIEENFDAVTTARAVARGIQVTCVDGSTLIAEAGEVIACAGSTVVTMDQDSFHARFREVADV